MYTFRKLWLQIGWVRLYARPVDTPNAEVRLTDDKFPGTGLEVKEFATFPFILSILDDLLINDLYHIPTES